MDIYKPLVALLAIVNPVGVVPFFIHFTSSFTREQRRTDRREMGCPQQAGQHRHRHPGQQHTGQQGEQHAMTAAQRVQQGVLGVAHRQRPRLVHQHQAGGIDTEKGDSQRQTHPQRADQLVAAQQRRLRRGEQQPS